MLLREAKKSERFVHVLAANLIDHETHLVRRLTSPALNRARIGNRSSAHGCPSRCGLASTSLARSGGARGLFLDGLGAFGGFRSSLTNCHWLLASLCRRTSRNAGRLLVDSLRSRVTTEETRRSKLAELVTDHVL